MPVTCIVVNCGSRADRDHLLSFARIPTVKNSVHFPHINELSKKRKEMWLAAIKTKDLTESIMRNQRICSKHFITGKPSALSDENHPDWVPSQHMGHVSQAHSKRKSDVDRKLRADKRTKLNDEACEPSILECNLHKDESDQDVEQPLQVIETGIATQTDLTMTMLTTKLEQLKFAHKKICDLEKKIENTPLGFMDNQQYL